ncbi:hypothetical protein JQT66_04450 [Sulfitobacter mediterraneus]|uniref:hypothetical protein n=1 Tax=Sulfitobacter mediterraneus TaxID=83219 RepID=UPI0019319520|nr:hypothetical protein [Sulfitobacter mediterraneus]MBM1309068.1 hypothetical protein [Sulfitobacter mediterraneus]MBM1312952.1 hypothetical protein [Sulfitobacter mediterraneus]MBM1321335.1 hypothetical protein [Sulfitobacter mediterraneus]MBM1325222.1 hypothetical protein [Sulfitobacter mediterraneus]MBM1396569.1 hypothetical protein [Sulfitobacter mediterraneus]
MKFLTAALLLSSTFSGTGAAAEEAKILKQDDSPVTIETYTNRYKSPDRVGDGTVIHRVEVKNISEQDIDAYGIGIYIFDSFNRDMGRPFIGYAMSRVKAGALDTAGFEQRPRSAFLFENNGQGLAYIAIVRLADGTIWEADTDKISRQIEDFELQIVGDPED